MDGAEGGTGQVLEGRGLRALKVAVVVMGVMIVIAVVGLVAGVVFKLRARPATRAAVPVAAAVPTEGGAALTVLDEPAGTRVVAVVAAGPRLALSLQGGGPDRVVLLDPASGTVTARVSLAR